MSNAQGYTGEAGLSIVTQANQLGLVGNTSLSVPMPFESEIILYDELRVAGTTHVKNIDEIIAEIPDEAQLVLIREPQNQADERAIRIEHNGKKMGYIPADHNFLLARLMDGGKTLKAKLLSYELRDSWWRVYVQISLVD